MADQDNVEKLVAKVSLIADEFQLTDKAKQQMITAAKDGLSEAVKGEGAKKFFSKLFPQLGLEVGSDGKFTKDSLYGAGSKATGMFAEGLLKMMKTVVGMIEGIYRRVVDASPLLQAIETLFNLAMRLFFMPLGNKLGEEFIPAMLDLIDHIMELWNEWEGMGPEEIIDHMVDAFLNTFVQFFLDIGKGLETHGGLLGAIGKVIAAIADFTKNHLAGFLNWAIDAIKTIIDWFPQILGAIVAFQIMSKTLMIAQLIQLAMPDWAKGITGTIAIGSILAAVGGIGTAAFASSLGGAGSGVSNHISSRSPVSNMNVNTASGGDSYTVNVYGYTDSELGGIIEDKVNDMSNRSRLRSGF